MDTEKGALPISDPDKHPIAIFVAENKEMGAHDLNIFVGNFKSEADALRYADIVKEFLEENADAEIGRVQ